MKRLFKIVKLLAVNLLCLLLLGEVTAWLIPALFEKPPPYNTAQLNDLLGWRPKSNYTFDGLQQRFDGTSYPVQMRTAYNGFRKYPTNPNTSKKKLFVIGDSFTQAVEVSDGKCYYDYLEQKMEWQVYAFGMAGYGTLQQLLILEQYLDSIQPDMVLLQFCTNDFIDNDFELERNANYLVGLRRPYLETDGKIVYHHPLSRFKQWIRKSRFLKFVDDKFIRLQQKIGWQKKNTSEQFITEKGLNYFPFQQSVHTTTTLLQRFKNKLPPDMPFHVFCSDRYEPQQGTIQQICESLAIPFTPFPLAAFKEIKNTKEPYTSDGYHWNEVGHEVIGKVLLNYFNE